ncbi:MAG: VanZ family protein [Corynebacterium sp.]|uniref:VanZ family protein n=1 Tax=Corynebacterium sp. TaxID=1720 RepID=UPI0026DD17CF|nr:VanZ family protein [Corynebacterium sp.]MDO4761636.1 VanZ family protein [Corynebacterium sp.]
MSDTESSTPQQPQKNHTTHIPAPTRAQKIAFTGIICVIITLTTLKSFFSIGGLWVPQRQRVRILELQPFDLFFHSHNWFAPLFDTIGNIGFFIPFGMMTAVLLARHNHRIIKATGYSTLFSLFIESSQYIFALGRTDIDDLWCNTLGGFLGASIVTAFGHSAHRLWTSIAVATSGIFIALLLFDNTQP